MDNALTPDEMNIMAELAHLTQGAVSSVLNMLIDPDLKLSEPEMSSYPDVEAFMLQAVPSPSVLATLQFQNGFESPVAYVINMDMAGVLADVMIGNPSDNPAGGLSDIQMSAIGEAVSQIVGATANNMSQFLSKTVEISAPEVTPFSANTLTKYIPEFAQDGVLVATFHLKGSQVVPEGNILQIIPMAHAKSHVQVVRQTKPKETMLSDDMLEDTGHLVGAAVGKAEASFNDDAIVGMSMNAQEAFSSRGADPVTVQPVEFPSFNHHPQVYGENNKNLELVMDVALNLTVELGRTELPIKEVLELTRGSVVELNRVAGESVDLFANGKMIAKGEVVVIEDNFGLRITSIVSPADRLRGL